MSTMTYTRARVEDILGIWAVDDADKYPEPLHKMGSLKEKDPEVLERQSGTQAEQLEEFVPQRSRQRCPH